MRGVGVHARVPQQRHGEFLGGEGEGEGVQARAQVPRVSLRNGGDEVGGAGQRQGHGKAADDRDDVSLQSESLEHVVDEGGLVAFS